MTDEQLSALLRLKRHETPPPGYFDRLLADVHRRQRAELLRQPLWKIALERFQTFFGEHSMSPLSYAGAVASVLVAGMVTMGAFNLLPGRPESGGTLAQVAPVATPVSGVGGMSEAERALERRLAEISAQRSRTAHSPRYVIDAQPVSYERPFSF